MVGRGHGARVRVRPARPARPAHLGAVATVEYRPEDATPCLRLRVRTDDDAVGVVGLPAAHDFREVGRTTFPQAWVGDASEEMLAAVEMRCAWCNAWRPWRWAGAMESPDVAAAARAAYEAAGLRVRTRSV